MKYKNEMDKEDEAVTEIHTGESTVTDSYGSVTDSLSSIAE